MTQNDIPRTELVRDGDGQPQTNGQQQTSGEDQPLATAPRRVVAPPTDVRRLADRYVFELDVPGIDAASLDVTFCEETLRVRGAVHPREVEGQPGSTYAEFELPDAYERAFQVKDRIDVEQLSARLADGVLRVELPLERPAQTRIAVTAG